MKVITGSYTQHVIADLKGTGKGIACFDLDEEIGQLQLEKEHKTINTGYLNINTSAKFIYTFQELSVDLKPNLICYKVGENDIELLSQTSIEGGLPCHVLFLEKEERLIVSCYQTGNVLVYTLDHSGVPVECIQDIQFKGSSLNKERQEASHAHMSFYIENKNTIVISDLGADKLYFFKIDANGLLEKTSELEVPKGGGPRHLCMHPSGQYLFVINEMTAELSLIEHKNGKWEWIKNVSMLQTPHNNHASASTIKISPCGKYIYGGIRSINAIATMQFNESTCKLEFISHTNTHGLTPRDFELSKDGKWLLVANQDSASISVFERNKESGDLVFKSQHNGVESICCVKFYE